MMQAPVLATNWRRQGAGNEHGYLSSTARSLDYGSPAGLFEFAERGSDTSMHSARADCFLADDVKIGEVSKLDANGYSMNENEFYEEVGHDMFDMSSFFREPGNLRMDTDEVQPIASDFADGLIRSSTTNDPAKQDLIDEQQNESSDTVADYLQDVSDSSADSVVMGIPYYVACQWQQMQQQQQQQQQAVMMLWWQAYLSGACNMMGPKGMNATTQLGWSLPAAGLAAFHGAYTNFGDDCFYQHMLLVDDKANATNTASKRRRKNDSSHQGDANQGTGKKGRRPRHDERVCKNCGTNETPFWRKDKQDGLPLCNACGLYLSKNDAPRPKVLWKTHERSLPTQAASSATTPVAASSAKLIV